MRSLAISILAVLLMGGMATAGMVGQVGSATFDTIDASTDFSSGGGGFGTLPYTLDGLTFDDPDDLVATVGVGFSTACLYQNGGSSGMLSFVLASGADMNQVQLDVGNGWSANPHYVWVRTYNNGTPTGSDLDFDIAIGGTISFWTDGATTFDEVRIAAYNLSSTRNQHIEGNYSAVSIDNLILGTGPTAVPEPASLALFGLGAALLIGVRMRRRRPRA
jgi:PEP-CTERM motif-containing protein